MRTPSITFRLTLFFAIASIVVLLAVGYLLGAAVEAHFVELDRVELDGKLKLVRHTLSKVRDQADLDALPQLFDDALVGHPGLSISVFAPDHRLLFASSDAVFPVGHTHESIARRSLRAAQACHLGNRRTRISRHCGVRANGHRWNAPRHRRNRRKHRSPAQIHSGTSRKSLVRDHIGCSSDHSVGLDRRSTGPCPDLPS